MLWIEFVFFSCVVLEELFFVCSDLCCDVGGQDFVVVMSVEECVVVWEVCYKVYFLMVVMYLGYVNFSIDVCVLLYCLFVVVVVICVKCDECGLNVSFVGYVGDGNFYVLFYVVFDDWVIWDVIYVIYDEMMMLIFVVGGICLGEYGIGLYKQKYLVQECVDMLELMCEVKVLFDLQGLFNLGKIF